MFLRGIKVRNSLKNWGCIDSDSCALCARCESIDHWFLNCNRVKSVWARFVPARTSVLGTQFVFYFFAGLLFLTEGPQSRAFSLRSIFFGEIEVTSWLVSTDDFSSRVARGANERVSSATPRNE